MVESLPIPPKKASKPKDLADRVQKAAGTTSVAAKDEPPVPTTWTDKPKRKKATTTRFTQPFSSKVDPSTAAAFEAVIEQKGMKTVSALDQAIQDWVTKNK